MTDLPDPSHVIHPRPGAPFAEPAPETAGIAAPNLYYLRTFHVVAAERSFTGAGRRLHLSQPAISAQIRALERHYRARLFDIRHRRVFLTAEGEALLPYADHIFRLIREADTAVAAVQGLQRGYLAFGASTTIGNYLLPPIVAQFAAAYPGIRVDVTIGTTADIVARIVADALPFGLVEAPVIHPQLRARSFGQDDMVLVAPPGHAWVVAGGAQPDDLRDTPLLRREATSGTQALVDRALERAGISMSAATVLGSTEALKEAVLAGLGLAWLPRIAVTRELIAGDLAIVPVPAVDLHRTLSIVAPHDRTLSIAEQAFLRLIDRSDEGDRLTD